MFYKQFFYKSLKYWKAKIPINIGYSETARYDY